MKTNAALATLPLALALAFVAPPSHGAPQAVPKPPPVEKANPQPKIKAANKLAVKNAAAVIGEKRNFEATLTTFNGTPIAGRTVKFRVEPKNGMYMRDRFKDAGEAKTDANGKATVVYDVPELTPASYALKVSVAPSGDDAGVTDEGNFGVVKGISKVDLKMVWKPELGPHGSGQVTVSVLRSSDDQKVTRDPLYFTVNGKKFQIGYTEPNGQFRDWVQLPNEDDQHRPISSWNVKAEFYGDEYYQPSTASASYTRP